MVALAVGGLMSCDFTKPFENIDAPQPVRAITVTAPASVRSVESITATVGLLGPDNVVLDPSRYDVQVNWRSADAQVLEVVSEWELGAEIRGRKVGTTRIIAEFGTLRDSVSVTVVPGDPARLTKVSGDGQQGAAGAALASPLVVEVRDANDNAVGAGALVTFTPDAGAGAINPTSSQTNASGRVSGSWTVGTVPGTQRAQALLPSQSSVQVAFSAQVVAAAPARIVAESGSGQIGLPNEPLPLQVVVRVRDRHGNPAPGATIQFSRAGNRGGVTPAAPVTDALGRARATWQVGQAITRDSLIARVVGVPDSLALLLADVRNPSFVVDSGGGQIGLPSETLPQQVVVRAIHPRSSTTYVPNAAVTFSVVGGGGTIGTTTTTTNSLGRARTAWTVGPDTGADTVRATLTTYPTAPTPLATAQVRNPTFVVDSGNGQIALPAESLPTLVVVRAIHPRSTTLPLANAAVTFSVVGSGGTIGTTTTTTNSLGRARTAWTVGADTGADTVRATLTSYPTAPTPLATAQVRNPTFVVDSGNGQIALPAETLPTLLVVRATHPRSATVPLANAPVTFTVVGNGGSVGTATTTTNAQGRARTAWTVGADTGTDTVRSALSGYPTALRPVATAQVIHSLAQLTTGGSHTCALTVIGTAYCWGFNSAGSVGDGTTTSRTSPVRVAAPLGVTFIAVSANGHSCALTSTGAAYCWGSNQYGQLGDGTTTSRTSPVRVAAPLGVTFTAVSAGADHSCGLTSAGAAYCWGWNNYGQLGDSTSTMRLAPVPVHQGALAFDQLTAGAFHTCGLTATGVGYCWGDNSWGQLGDSSTTRRWLPVPVRQGTAAFGQLTAGGTNTCGLTLAGAAYCWGFNGDGQLGDNSLTQRLTPVPVQQGAVAFVQLVTNGLAGGNHTCGLTAAGAAYCWGGNAFGQLGDNTTTQRLTPVPVQQGTMILEQLVAHGLHTCGLAAAGAAYCWGNNSGGQLGDNTTTQRITPVPVSRTWR